MSFPTQPDALTTAWLDQTLKARLNTTVTDFSVEFFGEGAGIIGQVTRLRLATTEGERTVIAKFPSPAEENRGVAAIYDMYGREILFYEEIADLVSLRVPDCYFTAFNAESQDFIILMEDLQDMRIGDQVEGCTAQDADLVLKGIAQLHASTWEFSHVKVISHNNPAQREGMAAGFQVGWPVVSEQFPDLLPDEADLIAERLPSAVGNLLDTMCQAPVSVVHADVRLDNIFFGANEIALVDWQSVSTSAPEQDLAYFVTQSLPQDVRESTDWVARYHGYLTAAGVSYYSLDQCRERYRTSALYLACYATVIAGTLDLGNERGRALGRTLFGNCMRSLTSLNAFELLT